MCSLLIRCMILLPILRSLYLCMDESGRLLVRIEIESTTIERNVKTALLHSKHLNLLILFRVSHGLADDEQLALLITIALLHCTHVHQRCPM